MIVFALRHANRTPDPADDLTPAGVARAKLLARILGESGIRTAYCSSAIRTQRTMEPLQNLLGAQLKIVTVSTNAGDHVQQIVDKVKALPRDAVAAVVGHSDTVGPIIEGLTGVTIGPIKAHEFDKLFVVSVAAGGMSSVALTRYGDPT
jgi:phosphohistidine phosphatase SixA